VKKFDDMFICFDTIHERDRHTHTQTLNDGMNRAYAQHRAAKIVDHQHCVQKN